MTCAGGISRSDLENALREITGMVEHARECGWDADATGEHRLLSAARALLATVDEQLADRVDELEQDHAHRPHFDREE